MADKNYLEQQFMLAEASIEDKVKRFYCNGVLAAYSPIDITLLLKTNSATVALINMGLPTAKDLIRQLQEGIAGIESALGQEILAGHEAHERVAQSRGISTEQN